MKKIWIIVVFVMLISCGCGRHGKSGGGTIFEENYENGSLNGWTGGKLQENITFQRSRYALQGISSNGSYSSLEIWKRFPIEDNTKLSFSYYCDNIGSIIVNCWSNKNKKNYSLVIRKPEYKKWEMFDEYLKDFGYDIGPTINSIHIAVPNEEGALIIIDNVRLSNE